MFSRIRPVVLYRRALRVTEGLGTCSYSTVSASDIAHFKQLLVDEQAVITDSDTLKQYNTDWMRHYKGAATVAVLPKTTEQVAAVLKHCTSRNLAVVPQAGNTSLVGGSVPIDSEVVLNTSRLNSIVSFDAASGVLVCEAGCILENLDTWLSEHGFCMPLDLGAKGSCQIGGNVSSNAGGTRFVRFGSLRSTVLGLEAVLADGTVLDLLTANRKDNTGYDLKQLLIGSEGTLAVITKVAIATPRRATSVNVAVLACHDFAAVTQLLALIKTTLGEVLSAVELMDSESVKHALKRCPQLRQPLQLQQPQHSDRSSTSGPLMVLVESSGVCAEHDSEKMANLLEAAFEQDIAQDGVVAQDLAQASELWSLREHVPIAASMAGYQYKYDVSLPMTRFYELVTHMREQFVAAGIEPHQALAFGYGHLGDGNLHLNVVCPKQDDAVLAVLEPYVFEWVVAAGGSISAEHGIGQHKRDHLTLQKGAAAVSLMKAVKAAFDPLCILNPNKVLPS